MEMCITSNVGTKAVKDYDHPFPILFRNKFRVFLCSDNRLMSNTTITKRDGAGNQYYNLTIRDLEKITINAMKSSLHPS